MKTNFIFKQGLSLISTLLLSLMTGVMAQNGSGNEMPNSIAVSSSDYSSLEWVGCPPPIDGEGCHITVLQGDPSKPNSDVLFRLASGASAPRHWHSSAERMIMVSGELHVTYDGEETRVLKAGDYAYGPANKPHDAKCADGEDCVLFIAFEKPVDSYVQEED